MPTWRLSDVAPPNAGAVLGWGRGGRQQWLDMSVPDGQTEAMLSGGVIPSSNLAGVKVADASFAITINGTVTQVGPIDMHLASDFSVIAAAIDANLTTADCALVDGAMQITTHPAAGSSISFARAPAAGTDVSALLRLTAATSASIYPEA